MNEGIVYVLTNPAMPKLVKIGKTGRGVETRLNDLYTTGVPLPFECAYAARVEDMDKVEKAFHNAFGPYRVNPRREFFEIEPEQSRLSGGFAGSFFLHSTATGASHH